MGLLRRALMLVVPAALVSTALAAQGITTAAIDGLVVGPDSAGIANATVTVGNSATGERWQTVTGASGRYALEYLSVGGPYSIEARAIGFAPGGTTRHHALAGPAAPGRSRARIRGGAARRADGHRGPGIDG